MSFVLARLFLMVFGQLAIKWLHAKTLNHDTLVDDDPSALGMSVFRTVYTQCILILVTLAYYLAFRLCCRLGGPRPRTQGVSGMRLTIRSVWTFVFGMGLVLFIVSYCFVGLNSVCMMFLALAVSVLAADELLFPRLEMTRSYAIGRSCALCSIAIGLFMAIPRFIQTAVEQFILKTDLYSIIFGIIFPFISQVTLAVVRDTLKQRLTCTIEMCEFGFPFTAFLGVFHLCVAYGQRQQADSDALATFIGGVSNHTMAQSVYFDFQYWYHFNDTMVNAVIRTDTPFLLFYLFAPLLYTPVCLCFIWCVLNGNAVDPLCSIVTVLALEYPVSHPLGALDIITVLFCWLGICVRLFCEYSPSLLSPNTVLYSTQGGGAQLPNFLFFTQTGPSMQECEIETLELSSDFPDNDINQA